MAGPLEGVKVLDFGRWMLAPVCARILADLGADVIKMELRGHPDPLRGLLPLSQARAQNLDMTAAAAIPNSLFDITNRGKRSITLNLAEAKGREIVYKLVQQADVLVHNWRQEQSERLGLDFETVAKYNPRLVYAVGSGWGPEGPDADEPAMDPAGTARSGMMYFWGNPDMPPVHSLGGIADQVTAMVMVEGILAALFARERTRIGQKVDVSILGSMIQLESLVLQGQLLRGFASPRIDRAEAANPLATYYECADGKWIMLSMYQDKFWPTLCKVMGVPELEQDPRFQNILLRSQNASELIAILGRIFATKPRADWGKILKENDLIYAPVQTIPEVTSDPQAIANGYILDFNHSEFGQTRVVGFPYRFSAMPLALGREAPQYNQHTEEVLQELGYNWDDIAKLKQDEIV